jgi:hypothetical protein
LRSGHGGHGTWGTRWKNRPSRGSAGLEAGEISVDGRNKGIEYDGLMMVLIIVD